MVKIATFAKPQNVMLNYKMIQHIPIFALVILISSCGNRNENTGFKSRTDVVLSDTIIPFHGLWAAEIYIRTLVKTKSPRQSQEFGDFFRIPKSYKETAVPYSYHEGDADYHIVKQKDSYYLKLDYDNNDSTEIVLIDNGNKIKIRNKIYVKVKENVGIPEDLLFKGQYNLSGKLISLNADGTIDGLDRIKFYSVVNDYFGTEIDDVDILYLTKTGSESPEARSFEFKSDTLLIYDVNCKEADENGTCLYIQKGQLKWTLTKK